MSTYKELFGKYVQSLATDPTTAAAVGQIWYNTTSNTFKTILASGAWVSGNPLLTAVNQSFTFGTQTDAVSAGGAAGYKSTAEKYNGTSWSAGNTITARKSGGSAGTGTAGVILLQKNMMELIGQQQDSILFLNKVVDQVALKLLHLELEVI
jgi:hypothetical protein